MAAVNPESGHAHLECSFRNCTELPITIRFGGLEVWTNKQLLTRHRLFGYTSNPVGADFRLPIPPKTEVSDYFDFGFTSTDCLCLEMDVYGHTDLPLHFKVHLEDTLGNQYYGEAKDCVVFAKGKYLWKVR